MTFDFTLIFVPRKVLKMKTLNKFIISTLFMFGSLNLSQAICNNPNVKRPSPQADAEKLCTKRSGELLPSEINENEACLKISRCGSEIMTRAIEIHCEKIDHLSAVAYVRMGEQYQSKADRCDKMSKGSHEAVKCLLELWNEAYPFMGEKLGVEVSKIPECSLTK